jgi:hypothetical protein
MMGVVGGGISDIDLEDSDMEDVSSDSEAVVTSPNRHTMGGKTVPTAYYSNTSYNASQNNGRVTAEADVHENYTIPIQPRKGVKRPLPQTPQQQHLSHQHQLFIQNDLREGPVTVSSSTYYSQSSATNGNTSSNSRSYVTTSTASGTMVSSQATQTSQNNRYNLRSQTANDAAVSRSTVPRTQTANGTRYSGMEDVNTYNNTNGRPYTSPAASVLAGTSLGNGRGDVTGFVLTGTTKGLALNPGETGVQGRKLGQGTRDTGREGYVQGSRK